MITEEDIRRWFAMPSMKTGGKAQQIEKIYTAARVCAQVIWSNTSPGADQDAAIRRLREALWTATEAIKHFVYTER